MEFTATLAGKTSWVGIGLSSRPDDAALSMGSAGEGTDIVACNDGIVQRYWVTGQTLGPGQETTPANLESASCSQLVGGPTVLKFTRTLAKSSGTAANEVEIREGSPQMVFFAHGADKDTTIKYHAVRGGLSVDLTSTGAVFTNNATKHTIINAIRDAGSADLNPFLRDVNVKSYTATNKLVCDKTDDATLGGRVDIDGECWENVHPDAYNVVDASSWTTAHPGNDKQKGFFPITAVALQGGYELRYPASHGMDRYRSKKKLLPIMGRWGDQVDFKDLPSSVQTNALAVFLGAVPKPTSSVAFTDTCGSPLELSSLFKADEGFYMHRYTYMMTDEERGDSSMFLGAGGGSSNSGKQGVFNAVSLTADDQLRQRMAHSLFQIIVLSVGGVSGENNRVESWSHYRDIYIRHALGNYRDLLREVSFSPMMGTYLTYYDNKATSYSGTAPDENYAREIMQLFTLGLYELNIDGTPKMTTDGGVRVPKETYDNNDIVSFARAWTGFARRAFRGNLEASNGETSSNYIDPMYIQAIKRDVFPKRDLHDGYIGDAYPVCADLPERAFLRQGARYRYLGHDDDVILPEGMAYIASLATGDSNVARAVVLDAKNVSGKSALYAALCRSSTGVSGACTFPAEVELTSKGGLPCYGAECRVETLRMLKLVDGTGVVAWYEYVRVACVDLSFIEDATVGKKESGDWTMCLDPKTKSAGTTCCNPSSSALSAKEHCEYIEERVTFAEAAKRCALQNLTICGPNGMHTSISTRTSPIGTGGEGVDCKYNYQYTWQNKTCMQKVQINDVGFVNIVHDPAHATSTRIVRLDVASGHKNKFEVSWLNGGLFPEAKSNCVAPGGVAVSGCTVVDSSCLCDIAVSSYAAYVH